MRYLLMAATLCASDAAAEDVAYRFTWTGANGYSVEGVLAYPQDVPWSIIRESDLTCFAITGFQDGRQLGRWTLTMLGPDTTWRLHFDRLRDRFVVEGEGIAMPQAWNMNGAGDNCGRGGFGFNLGNLGQDLCFDNILLEDSRVPPPTPLPAQRLISARFPADACHGPDLLSLSPDLQSSKVARTHVIGQAVGAVAIR